VLVAHPVATRRAAAPALARLVRLAHTFGTALPVPALAGVAGLAAVEVLVLVVWASDTRAQAGAGTALRVGADIWLLAYGVPLRLPTSSIHLFPLGMAAWPVLVAGSSGYRLASQRAVELAAHPMWSAARLLRRSPAPPTSRAQPEAAAPTAAGRAARGRVRRAWLAVDLAAVVTAQTALVCVVSTAASSPDARPATGIAALAAAGLSALGGVVGVLAGHRRLGAGWRRIPPMPRIALSAGAGALAALGAVGAVGLAGALAVHAGGVTSAANSLDPGVGGGVGLFVAEVVLLPNLVVWAICYALGTGFAAGPAVTVTPASARPGSLPDLPVLRVLPSAPLPGWAWLVLALAPLAAGLVLALAVRQATPVATFVGRLSLVGAGTVVCALLLGALAALSGGGVGGGAASRFGPAPGWTILAALGEVGMAAALVTSIAELLRRHAPPTSAGAPPTGTARPGRPEAPALSRAR
jgi:hypothetical protein